MLVDRSLNLTGAEIEKFRFRFCDWIAKISTNLQKHIWYIPTTNIENTKNHQ